MGSLILKRANASRLSGQLSDDDYDGVIIGRILKVPIAPAELPWMWASGQTVTYAERRRATSQRAKVAMAALQELAT